MQEPLIRGLVCGIAAHINGKVASVVDVKRRQQREDIAAEVGKSEIWRQSKAKAWPNQEHILLLDEGVCFTNKPADDRVTRSVECLRVLVVLV